MDGCFHPSAMEITRIHRHSLLESIDAMRNDSEADMILICENTKFPVHKLILKANSPYYRAMLQSDMKECKSGKVEVKDMEAETVKIILDFMYLGEVPNTTCEDRIFKVLSASHLLQLGKLFQYCCNCLLSVLSLKNFHEVWEAAEKYDIADIRKEVLHYVIVNLTEVIQDPEFLRLSVDKMRQFLEAANQNARITDVVLSGLVKWLCDDLETRKAFAGKLLPYVNPLFVDENFMKSLLSKEHVNLPMEIITKMIGLGWPVCYATEKSTSSTLLSLKGVKLIFFSDHSVEKKFDSVSYVEQKVHGSYVQILDLSTMTWEPLKNLPGFSLKGVAMCQYKDKIYMVGGDLKSVYVIYHVATNKMESVDCCEFDGKVNGILRATKSYLYFIERNDEGQLCGVNFFKPGASRVERFNGNISWSSATVIAAQNAVFVYYKSADGARIDSCRLNPGKIISDNLIPIHIVPRDTIPFFVMFNELRFGFYEENGKLHRLQYDDKSHNYIFDVLTKSPSNLKEVTCARFSKDPSGFVFVATARCPYQMPSHLLQPITGEWKTLPPASGHCCIPEGEGFQKVYFVDDYS